MTWVNPLDKVPQIPVAWANHIAQGGLGVCVLATMLAASEKLSLPHSIYAATAAMFVVSVTKKVVDFVKEHESVQVCVGKALVTMVWPVSLVVVAYLVGRI